MASRKQIVLRVDSKVKSGASRKAREAGMSLNAYAERVLSRAAGVKAKSK